jgi:hypothetical protein
LSSTIKPAPLSPATLRTAPLALDPAVRGSAAVGLVSVGVIHALEIQGQLSGAVWLTVGFCALAAVAPVSGLWLLIRPTWRSWLLALAVSLSAALGYVLTRSLAVPGDPGDRGNWLEPLGLAALIIEWLIVFLAILALRGDRSAAARETPVSSRAGAPASA